MGTLGNGGLNFSLLRADKEVCMVAELDFYFPYMVLFYGSLMTLVTSLHDLREKAQESMNPEIVQWFYGHRGLGLVCLFVGGLWSLQRLLG